MSKVFESSSTNSGGLSELVVNSRVTATVYWRSMCINGVCHEATQPEDLAKVLRLRLQDEQKGDLASPSKAKAIALLLQVEAELSGGQKTLDDGTPILGATE